MNQPDCTVVTIAPWQATLYQALLRPITLRDALRATATLADHRLQLDQAGDALAASGAAAQLWIAIVKLAGVAAGNVRALGCKAKALGEHRAVWSGEPLCAVMVQAAIVADLAALAPSPHDRARIDRLLQGRAP